MSACTPRSGPCPIGHLCYLRYATRAENGATLPAGTPFAGFVGTAGGACGVNGQPSYGDPCKCCSGWASHDGRCDAFSDVGEACLTNWSCIGENTYCDPDSNNNYVCQGGGGRPYIPIVPVFPP